ncbi:MAG: sulfite exporter TauE/SafE family protein [Candidatus Brennerbacteria bacterium]|nr:sulfite exporter TauE/SafE family protein [Candidatus Brennerbacteria bacterium]
MDPLSLVIPAFIAGVLTFVAPCTLPLVPGYLGFISGVSLEDLKNPEKSRRARARVMLNGLFYVIGFSVIFIALGSLFGLAGAALFKYRIWLSRVGGIFVILFGLYMILGAFRIPFLNFLSGEKQFRIGKFIKPGNPLSSFLFGSAFAFGWTPCVGPILGSILIFASSSATVGTGAFLLTVFSLGLAVPFLLIAAGIGSARSFLTRIGRYLGWVSVVGGLFLIFLGVLLITNQFAFWLGYAYRLFDFINYESLLNYL